MSSAQYPQLLFIAVIIGVFYFLVIKPQQKRAKQQKEMVSAIKPGDEIVTIGGIFGTVVEAGERLRIRVASGAEMEIAKQAVGQIVPAKSADTDAAESDEAEDSAQDADAE
jgi:preprotein translocase subunit YajC